MTESNRKIDCIYSCAVCSVETASVYTCELLLALIYRLQGDHKTQIEFKENGWSSTVLPRGTKPRHDMSSKNTESL